MRIEVQVLNLSPEGAMIEHREALSPGGSCHLFLSLGGRSLCLHSRIIWSHVHSRRKGQNGEAQIRFRSGLYFPDLPEETRAPLERYLGTLRPSASNPEHS
jgi:hypothetical protein